MSNIEITIRVPELAALAEAIQHCFVTKPISLPTPAPATIPVSANPTPVPAAPAPVAQTTPIVVPTPVPATAPMTAAPIAPAAPAPVPTAAPTYNLDQLAKEGAKLAQAGKMPQLLALLQQYGVQTVTQIPAAQYGAFAAALRDMGAQI